MFLRRQSNHTVWPSQHNPNSMTAQKGQRVPQSLAYISQLQFHHNSVMLFTLTVLYFIIKETKANWSQIRSGKARVKQDILEPQNMYNWHYHNHWLSTKHNTVQPSLFPLWFWSMGKCYQINSSQREFFPGWTST